MKRISSLEELKAFAREIVATKAPRQILLLDGPMGVGKTQFTKFLLEELGSSETVSPSYAIHNSYRLPGGDNVEHFDLYRLENADDLESTGFWDLFEADSGLVLIEWAQRLDAFGMSNALPRSWSKKKIEFSFGDSPNERVLKLT